MLLCSVFVVLCGKHQQKRHCNDETPFLSFGFHLSQIHIWSHRILVMGSAISSIWLLVFLTSGKR